MARITCTELIDRGDLALRENDRQTLARISRLLASRMGDPLAGRLHQLARLCVEGEPFAARWRSLRETVRERMLIAGS